MSPAPQPGGGLDLRQLIANAIAKCIRENGNSVSALMQGQYVIWGIEAAGYAVVPVEPTEEMRKAGKVPTRQIDLGNGTTTLGLGLGADASSIWSAMLAARPKVE